MKLVYCDFIAYGGLHTGFNSALVKVLNQTFQPDRIEFYSEETHKNICQSKIEDENVVYFKLSFLPKSLVGGLKTMLKDLIGCIYLVNLFFTTQKKDIICVALAYPFAQFVLYLLSKVFKRQYIFVCQHGELEILFNNAPASTLKRNYFSIENFIFNRKSNIHNIILGESIFNNIRSRFPNLKVVVIDHPYIFNYNSNDSNIRSFSPLIIGAIGSTGFNKGTQYVFELAELLKEHILNGDLKIKIIGKLEPIFNDLDTGLVEHQHTSLLPEEQFKSEIESIHYSLLLRDNSMNKLTASGTFLDSVNYLKPYLSLKGEYIGFYHLKQPNAGELFDGVFQIAERIDFLIQNKKITSLKYDNSILAIRELQNELSISNIAIKLKNQLS